MPGLTSSTKFSEYHLNNHGVDSTSFTAAALSSAAKPTGNGAAHALPPNNGTTSSGTSSNCAGSGTTAQPAKLHFSLVRSWGRPLLSGLPLASYFALNHIQKAFPAAKNRVGAAPHKAADARAFLKRFKAKGAWGER